MVGVLYLPKETGYSDDPISKTETSGCSIVINSFIKVSGLSNPEFLIMSYMTLMNRLSDYVRFRWAHCLLHAVQLYAAQLVRTSTYMVLLLPRFS